MKQHKIYTFLKSLLFSLLIGLLSSCNESDWGGPLAQVNCSNCKIFVSAATSTGNVGPKDKADLICSNDVNYPGTGTYKALLVYSDGSRRACSTPNCTGGASENVDWVLHPNTTYMRVDGTTVIGTTTASGIFTFPLTNSFSDSADAAWTGAESTWETAVSDRTCTNWTIGTGGPPPIGRVSLVNNTGIAGISFGVNCTELDKLICVQQ